MKKRTFWVFTVLCCLVILVSLLSLCMGSAEIDVISALLGKKGYETDRVILISIRLPRLLSSIVAGVGLSVAGVLLQNVIANPLASPNTIGVNAGAGLAVIVTLAFLPSLTKLLPIAAFFGALFTSVFIMAFSKWVKGGKATVILAGIACSSFLQAGISFVMTLDTDVLASYNGFSVGSFAGVEMNDLLLPAILVALAFGVSLLLSGRIMVLTLGDSMAHSLGVRVTLLRNAVLVLASMSAAAVISYAGLLGFVGLVVPHIAGKLVGMELKRHFVASALCGALLVTLADLVGRTLFAPSEVSVGVIMAFIGAPFFFFLIIKRRDIGA